MSKRQKQTEPQQQYVLPVMADPEIGLTAAQVQERIEGGWISGQTAPSGKTTREIIAGHCFTFFNLIFLVLAVALALVASSPLNMGFLVVAVANTAIGIFQELRAKRAVDQLTLVISHPVQVIRDGKLVEVSQDSIVRDDIAVFSQGDQLCADGVVRSGMLWMDESLISGEADPVQKKPGDSLRSGSVVMAGTARVQLTAVGSTSYSSHLSGEAKKNPSAKKSEMMRSLDRLILFVGLALIPVGGVLFYQEYSVLEMGLRGSTEGTVAALVGMIPEGLYLLTSIAIAASAVKLSRQKVLVQDMNCIEALARVDVLCLDKTGTITEPNMDVEHVIALSGIEPERLETILISMYGAKEPDNATAAALHDLYRGETDWVETRRIPFSPEYKWSGVCFQDEGAFLVGAPEFLLGDAVGQFQEQISQFTSQGGRVLMAVSYDGDPEPGQLDGDKILPLALIVLSSRIREQARDTIKYFVEQGVSLRVISGDDATTVSQIALRAGVPGAENAIDATTLHSPADYAQAAKEGVTFGRVTPDQKRKLIAALQAQGHTVAMTGDGVNDLLAMKQSDCSIAMASGAQAATQLASLVLLESDFSKMPPVVAEGRRVINNIQRAATLFLVKNIFSLFLSLISLFTDWPYPLQPMHLTVISCLTIGLPSFLLAMEPNYERNKGHFLRGVLRRAFPGGLTNVFAVLVCQAFMAVYAVPAQTVTTVCAGILAVVGMMVLFQVCKPFNRFRKLIWAGMLLCLVAVFTWLGAMFELTATDNAAQLLMLTLLLMTPTVFFAIQRLFDLGDGVYSRIQTFFQKLRKPKPSAKPPKERKKWTFKRSSESQSETPAPQTPIEKVSQITQSPVTMPSVEAPILEEVPAVAAEAPDVSAKAAAVPELETTPSPIAEAPAEEGEESPDSSKAEE